VVPFPRSSIACVVYTSQIEAIYVLKTFSQNLAFGENIQ